MDRPVRSGKGMAERARRLGIGLTLWRPGQLPGVDHELIWGGVGLFLLAAARFVPGELISWYFCPFRRLTGVPCLSCGITRSFLHMVRGEVSEAFAINPLGAMICLFLALFIVYAAVVVLFRLPRPRPTVESPALRLALRLAVVLVALANWAWLIWHGV